MTIDEACVGCIINQSVKVADAIHASEALSNELVSTVTKMSKDFSFDDTPPEIASYVYEKMAQIANKTDLYDEVKVASTKKALSFVPLLKEKLLTSDNKLLTATKIAVAGNVIDLAAAVEFDLKEELEKIFHTHFAYNDFDMLKEKLTTAKSVLVIGDNVGEHIFDYMFIETLKELYPHVKYSYMVRGNPIINDVTIVEAKEAGFDKLCELVDSGVNTPGFTYNRANSFSKELFDSVDLVISKGMGNYECLSPSHRKNICFLLKVKCDVVAASLQKQVGDIVCKMA
ncbi:MAG: ARMT1-like domain-containing protein [Sulfurimonas sp.]|uniref:damage-control phosphatase ARMT1 family protein n=1 Tax=Sulfurimonas sp. TaxID=2022749 RepID=UPI0026098336|nr:ARMT1-like domain-containing protein [Sulfurimonas sp.]MCW8895646.1 ARMT1-like domain-containing protein [Sulfurimonas sp.]MCW8954190.1 ARMT1-like domain-containing protein [Sulfurimonas sp.]MCW9067080.1 ARMT1-like domain-containing protein [Sulfurimonas sp.]